MQAECEALVAAHPHRQRITLTPYLAYAEAMDALRHYDLLVIPSRHDGWGAVVNEALQRGVPVIATDEVGAHDLLGAPWRGTIVPSDDVHALAAALQARIDAGPLTRDDRLRILEWSSVISGEVFTDYLEAILAYARTGGTRPAAPWLTDGSGLPTAR
jgi:glycosyltransferase involved in cell wall biosynthesis